MGRGPGTFGLRATGQPLDGLIQLITQATGRTVVDKTGLKGLFDFQLQFDPEVMQQVAARQGVNAPPLNSTTSSSPPSESPALMTAIRDQLGLRLDSQRGLVEVLVVDHVEAPTPD